MLRVNIGKILDYIVIKVSLKIMGELSGAAARTGNFNKKTIK